MFFFVRCGLRQNSSMYMCIMYIMDNNNHNNNNNKWRQRSNNVVDIIVETITIRYISVFLQ